MNDETHEKAAEPAPKPKPKKSAPPAPHRDTVVLDKAIGRLRSKGGLYANIADDLERQRGV